MHLAVLPAPGNLKPEATGRLIRKLRRPGIVYCATTKAVDELYAALTRARVPVARYHGKMTATGRGDAQQHFMRKKKRIVMVATSAFGMGIDKPDIRYVLHYQVPGSVEQYVQEAGRAGRDGRRADCILLYDPADLDIQVFLNEQSHLRPGEVRRVVRALTAWAQDGRPVTLRDLATSAGLPQTRCRAVCAQLEDLGVVSMTTGRQYEVGARTRLGGAGRDLASRLQICQREDERRIAVMATYAEAEGCRSAFIRRWFGEQAPPECGRCDRCVGRTRVAREARQMVERAERAVDGDQPPMRKRRRRRRRRRAKDQGAR